MLFKLSVKNMKKSFKDYAIYFLTLVLGVAIFYMFNSLDSQQAMLKVSESTRQLIGLMIDILSVVSVFIAIVLGFLIVYANNFLINRRKREFGIYMTLGMGRRQISKIILLETLLIGIISLAIGIFVGVFGSQLMSVLVAKLFEADMSEFTFVFSSDACIKTCIYFAVMFLAVMIFNTITISRCKLINLLTAMRKNEKVRMKNPVISVLVFIVSVVVLSYAYWKVTRGVNELDTIDKIIGPIVMGIVGTVGIFWSLSGFILRVIQSSKKIYLRGTNMFVLRQLNNKINTTVVAMSVICIMLFMTISVLSSSLSIHASMDSELKEMTPVDLNLQKIANLPESYTNPRTGKTTYYTEEQIEDSKKTIVKVSDYNKLAQLYGLEQYTLEDDEFIVLCDFDTMTGIRNEALKGNNTVEIDGKEYHSKYNECRSGFLNISTSHTNTGIILLPDSFEFKEEWKQSQFLAANYNADTEEEKIELDKEFTDEENSLLCKKLDEKGIQLDGMTKIVIIESSKGILF